ncbi:MAG: aminotransferase class I/II-fold pyridoxal phosphate-dependent enzyme [Gemmatimonadaceae bacterium]|nr:aminotransferase class I/II-fold pyridoxal phosphate-dependent enzyme [Gemmatimonadaceae bacterium]
MIDIRSDTVTRPSPGMRQAIATAEVGDDYLDGDPTTRRLEVRVAELLGKEKGLFFPSGTMANQTAVWTLSEPGTEVYADLNAHLVDREMVAAAVIAGVQMRTVQGEGPMMDSGSLERVFRPASPFSPRASLVCLENTHNGAGGLVTPLAGIKAMHDVARAKGCAVFLDGARLWNASAATGTSLRDFARYADLVMVSFAKGLGAPAGAALVGDEELIDRANEHRKRLGGVMRQSGILAAGALYGLEHNVGRLSEDHANAARFAEKVDHAIAATVVPPETNIVMIDLAPGLSAHDVARRAREDGVLVGAWTPSRVRAVLHLDARGEDVDRAGEVVLSALDESWRALGDTSEWPAQSSGRA